MQFAAIGLALCVPLANMVYDRLCTSSIHVICALDEFKSMRLRSALLVGVEGSKIAVSILFEDCEICCTV